MSLVSSYFLAINFVIGFIILGLIAYMYDSINKTIPKTDKENDLFSANGMLFSLLLAPFKYVFINFKNRKYLAIIPFMIFIALMIIIPIFGYYMIILQ